MVDVPRGSGAILCTVRFLDARSDPPDRIARDAASDPHLSSADEIRVAGRALCGEAEVRAEAWCPGADGRWQRVFDRDVPLCDRP